MYRFIQTDVEKGIFVGRRETQQRNSVFWGTAPLETRWVYSSNNKRRAAYEIFGWVDDFNVTDPTFIEVYNWYELAANKKSFGVWYALNSYRPNFALWGN